VAARIPSYLLTFFNLFCLFTLFCLFYFLCLSVLFPYSFTCLLKFNVILNLITFGCVFKRWTYLYFEYRYRSTI